MKVTLSHCLRVTALLLVGTAQLAGQTPKEVVVLPGAQLFAITGKVEVGKEELDGAKRSSRPKKAEAAQVLEAKPGDVIRTGEGAGASITLGNGATTGTARLGPDTAVKLPEGTAEPHSLELLKGRLFLNINGEQLKQQRQGEFRLKTPAALLAVKGTRFFAVAGNQEILGTQEGTVSVTTAAGTVLLPAGKMLEIKAGVAAPPRQMTPAEANVSGEYAKANLDEIPVHLATTTQKSVVDDGVVVTWGSSRGFKARPGRNYDLPIGEQSEPMLGPDGVLRYLFNVTINQAEEHVHKMQAKCSLRGDARKLQSNVVSGVTFFVRDPSWKHNSSAQMFEFSMQMHKANLLPESNYYSISPMPDKGVLRVTVPCGKIAAASFTDYYLELSLGLPQREQGKQYEIEMWDFKVLTLPE